ncbi:MAG: hypothetical protein Q7S40_30920 [Opitutaceae bacterium]|nr:hypothetical protein [Opitutaceae bacterium]
MGEDEICRCPRNGYVYDELTPSIRFEGTARKKSFPTGIDISYAEHLR